MILAGLLLFVVQDIPAAPPPPERAVPASAGPQEPAPARVEGKQRERGPESEEERRRREWWEGLSEEKKREFEERRKRWEQMSPEAREELRRRMEVYRAESQAAVAAMTPEERAAHEKLDGREKRRQLDRLVRARMAARAERLEEEIPEAREAMRASPDFEERRERSAEMVERYRRERMGRHIQRAVDEGWIGEQAAAWLREAPVHEAMAAVGEVEKWRYLKTAGAEGWWDAAEVAPEERQRIAALPAHEFFRELRAVDMPRGDGRRERMRGRERGQRGDGEGGEERDHRDSGSRGEDRRGSDRGNRRR